MAYSNSSADFLSSGFAESLRSMTEESVAQARDNYARLRDAVQAGNESIGTALEATASQTEAYTARVLELSKANAESAFDFGVQLMSTTSLPQAIELWSGCARRQVEEFVAQSRELAELGQQMLGAAGEAVKGQNS